LFNVGMRERLDQGVLTIYLTHRTSRLKLLGLALRALTKRLRDEKDFLELFSNQLKIQTRRKHLRVAFDGEIEVMQTPLQYRLRRRALRVIVPRSAEAE
jgi:diacylglycerol kinase family enzyme